MWSSTTTEQSTAQRNIDKEVEDILDCTHWLLIKRTGFLLLKEEHCFDGDNSEETKKGV
jgi:hypothetical protein